MIFKQFLSEGLDHFSYAIGCSSCNELAIIDPQRDIDIYLIFAQKQNFKIRFVLETHIHADFISGAKELADITGAKLLLPENTKKSEFQYQFPFLPVREGSVLQFGNIKLEALHTPGHTPEHLSYLVYDSLNSEKHPEMMISGDLLFAGTIGRTDIGAVKKEHAQEMFSSIKKIYKYSDGLLIYPAHGKGSFCASGASKRRFTTLGFEKLTNPFLDNSLTKDEFITQVCAQQQELPKYYLKLKAQNSEGPPLLDKIPQPASMTVKEFETILLEDNIILDLRHPLAFGSAHIEESINIGDVDQLSLWAPWVLPFDKDIYLIIDHCTDIHKAARALIRVGFDQVMGYVKGGMDQWISSGNYFETLPQIAVKDFEEVMNKGDEHILLDVRSNEEYLSGSIPGAKNIFLENLPSKVDLFHDKNQSIFIYCESGFRSGIACSIMQKEGFIHVHNIYGGMTAWKASNLPVEEQQASGEYS